MRFFTKGRGVGRTVVPVSSSILSMYKAKKTIYDPKASVKLTSKQRNYYLTVVGLYKKLKKDMNWYDSIVNKVGKKGYNELVKIHNDISAGEYDLKKVNEAGKYHLQLQDWLVFDEEIKAFANLANALGYDKQVIRPFIRLNMSHLRDHDMVEDLKHIAESIDYAEPVSKVWTFKPYLSFTISGDMVVTEMMKKDFKKDVPVAMRLSLLKKMTEDPKILDLPIYRGFIFKIPKTL